jgi:hypothetical protein
MTGTGLADERAHVDQAGRDDLSGTVDDVGAFGHAGGADAAPRVANNPIGDQYVARAVEVACRINDAGVGEQDGAATVQHDVTLSRWFNESKLA